MRPFEENFAKMLARKSMNYQELEKLVLDWGKNKGILDSSTPLRQLAKTQEELDETKIAITKFMCAVDQLFLDGIESKEEEVIKRALEEVIDGAGDMLVTIILFIAMTNQLTKTYINKEIDSTSCLKAAYDEIKGRTGKMVDGLFVKD
jgi:predicted transcriptional regulator